MFHFRKKDAAVGFLLLVLFSLGKTMWGFIEGTLTVWNDLIAILPYLGDDRQGVMRDTINVGVAIFLWLLVIHLTISFLRGVGLYVASDLERARKTTQRLAKIKLAWLWRILIGFWILTDALAGLQRVHTEEYRGKQSWGFITKVQRFHYAGQEKPQMEFIVYTGDFPSFVLGRINWYEVQNCAQITNPLSDLIATFASVGLAAPNDVYLARFTDEDLTRIELGLKEKEALLLAAGLLNSRHTVTIASPETSQT